MTKRWRPVSEFQNNLVGSHLNIGLLLGETGERAKALEALEKALEICQRLVQANPTVTQFQNRLALSHFNIGVLLGETGERAKALVALEKALEIQERLAQANPASTEFLSESAVSRYNIGLLLSETGEPAKALTAYAQALEIQEKLVKANPTVSDFQLGLAYSHNNIGLLLSDTGEAAKALVALEKALEIQERLVQANPTVTKFQNAIGSTLNNIATIEIGRGRFDMAPTHLLEAIKRQKQALAGNPAHPTYRRFLNDCYGNLLKTADGLSDKSLRLEAQRGLAELAASDPAFKELDRRIEEVVAGAEAKDVEELLAFAERGYDTWRFGLAARFWNQALEAEPILAENRQTQHAYNAACAAALTGCGEGVDEPPPDDQAKAKLRGQALRWLQSELETWKRHLENASAEQRKMIVRTLEHWQSDPDLSGVRDAAGLAKLPESERAEWESLWKRVVELLAKASAETNSGNTS